MFLQSCRWKWKETSTKGFFKLSKKNLRHRCFHSLATFCKGFLCENKGTENNNIKRNSSILDILTWLTLLSADAKSIVLLKVPSLNKIELHFPKCFQISKWFMDNLLCLFDVWKLRSYANANFSIFNNGQFYLLLSPWQKFPLEEIQLSVNCHVSILNFHSLKC